MRDGSDSDAATDLYLRNVGSIGIENIVAASGSVVLQPFYGTLGPFLFNQDVIVMQRKSRALFAFDGSYQSISNKRT